MELSAMGERIESSPAAKFRFSAFLISIECGKQS
jgi:hypothetical protein